MNVLPKSKVSRKLEQLYNTQIRNTCEAKRAKILACTKDYHFTSGELECKQFINDFEECINKFNKEFIYKYSQMYNFRITN